MKDVQYTITLNPPERVLSPEEKAAFEQLVGAASKQFEKTFSEIFLTGRSVVKVGSDDDSIKCKCVNVHTCGQP